MFFTRLMAWMNVLTKPCKICSASIIIGTKKEQWEQYLDTYIYAYNTSIHESTRFSPFELMFMRKPVLPIEINMGESDPTVTFMDFHEIADFTFSQVEMKTAKILKLLEEAKADITDAQTRQKEQYDRKHSQQG